MPFNLSYKASLVVTNSFSLCLSGKLLFFLIPKDDFAGPSGLQNFCWKNFFAGFMGVSLYLTSCFSLASFKIYSLSFIFEI